MNPSGLSSAAAARGRGTAYSNDRAPFLHSFTQTPHSVHSAGFITALSIVSSTIIAPARHAHSHLPQPVHSSLFTVTAISFLQYLFYYNTCTTLNGLFMVLLSHKK
jgi:hypothetical protein